MDVTSDRPPTRMKSASAVPLSLKEVRRRCFWGDTRGGEFFNRVERASRRLMSYKD